MHISYDNPEIRTLCEDESEAERKYDTLFAEQLQDRISELDAAPTLVDIIAMGLELTKDSVFHFDVNSNYQIAFTPINIKIKVDEQGFVIPELVTRIKILGIKSPETV